jgi:hypothetical protein
MAIPKIQNSEFFSLLNNKKDLLKKDIEKTKVQIGKEVVRLLVNGILKDKIILSPNNWRFHYLHKISNTLNVTVDLKILDETKISNHKYSIDFEFKKQDGKFIEFYTAYDSGDPREDGECFKTEKSDLLCQLLGNFEELLNISDIVFSSSSRNYTCFELSL